jgi:5-methylcytosine-specific restriction endonuclease McrA
MTTTQEQPALIEEERQKTVREELNKYTPEQIERVIAKTLKRQAYERSRLQYHTQYNKGHPKVTKKATDKYRQVHKEELKVRRLVRHREKPEERQQIDKRHYAKNSEKIKQHGREYSHTHRKELTTHSREYRHQHPEINNAIKHRRRARELNCEGSYTAQEFIEKCKAFNQRCAYCGATKRLTPDHIIPLSRGGTNNIDNILPVCKKCNITKNAKTLQEFVVYCNQMQIPFSPPRPELLPIIHVNTGNTKNVYT